MARLKRTMTNGCGKWHLTESPVLFELLSMKGGWVYIVTNKPRGTLYIGVTSDIARRAWEHREGIVDGFTKRYGLKQLVYVERHDSIEDAIQRETRLKHWPRVWKIDLIRSTNPEWDDLYETVML